ncbi:MAG: hypothetical protein R2864_15420 [Syntrophotaleaceae bacterium]
MKRIISIVLAAGFVLYFLGACSSDGSSELKSLMNKQVDVIENFAERVEKAQSSEDMAAAIEEYTAGMKSLVPKLREFQTKFPNYAQGAMPEELKNEAARLEKASAKLSTTMMSSMRYMMDARVQQAMTKMAEEVGDMN